MNSVCAEVCVVEWHDKRTPGMHTYTLEFAAQRLRSTQLNDKKFEKFKI